MDDKTATKADTEMTTNNMMIKALSLITLINLSGCCGGILDGICIGVEPVEENEGETEGDPSCMETQPYFNGEPQPGLVVTGVSGVCDHSFSQLKEIFNYSEFWLEALVQEAANGTTWGECIDETEVFVPDGMGEFKSLPLTQTHYGCLIDPYEQGKVSMNKYATYTGPALSKDFGEHYCGLCFNRADEPDEPFTHHLISNPNMMPTCLDPNNIDGHWPNLEATFMYDSTYFEGLFSSEVSCPVDQYPVLVTLKSGSGGPLYQGVGTRGSILCSKDADCSDLVPVVENELGGYVACASGPFDSLGFPAACAISGLPGQQPLPPAPDVILSHNGLDLSWKENVSCNHSYRGYVDCQVSEPMVQALLDYPNALLAGAFPRLDAASGNVVFNEDCNKTSACTLMGLGKGSAITRLGATEGPVAELDSAAEALNELLREDYTEVVVVDPTGAEVVYMITVVPPKLR